MDKFPEAFKRFEKDVDTSDIHSPYELLSEFGIWSGDHFRDTSKMRYAIGREAEKKGIDVPLSFYRREREPEPHIRVRQVVSVDQFERRGQQVYALRQVETGRFVSETRKPSRRAILREKRKGYHVHYVDEKIFGYVGMNYYAWQEHRKTEAELYKRYGHRKNTLLIWRGLSRKERRETIEHEISEAEKMKEGASYEKAHKRSPYP